MDKIIIIDDSGIKENLDKFLSAYRNHIRLSTDMDEVTLKSNSALSEIIKTYEEKHKIKISTKDKIWFYKSSEVVLFEAVNGKSKIFFKDKLSSVLNVSIDEIEKQLQDFFFIRIHKDIIVNGIFISRISGDPEQEIELTTGDAVPIEESYLKQISKFINKNF